MIKYDLEERTAKFGENIIVFVKNIKKTVVVLPLIQQLVRSATSIGANYYEANQASSKKDFVSKVYISKKEANETKYWLRMLSKADDKVQETCLKYLKEVQEFILIFSKIINSAKKGV